MADSGSWQKHFVKKESEIPVNKFRAYYFDERTAGIVRHTEIVDRPAANFVKNPFHGIPGDNFGGYWIGYFDFKERTSMTITTYQSHAESRIFIDGKNPPEGRKHQNSFSYIFEKGRHKIEAQHVSNYFSVSFLVNMIENPKILDAASLTAELGDTRNQRIWYCGAYESDNFDMSVDAKLEASENPVILFFGSYQPIIWKIANPHNTKIRAIVLSSHPQSSVENVPENIPVLYYDKLPAVYELIGKSSSSEPGRTFKSLAYAIQDITGQKPVGFSGKYGMTTVTVPEVILGEEQYSQFGMRLHGKKDSDDTSRKSRLDSVFE